MQTYLRTICLARRWNFVQDTVVGVVDDERILGNVKIVLSHGKASSPCRGHKCEKGNLRQYHCIDLKRGFEDVSLVCAMDDLKVVQGVDDELV